MPAAPPPQPFSPSAPSLAAIARAFLPIGLLSFGGATAQIAMLHGLAVEERRWLDEERFLRALNLCMLLPGPEAQQLATYIGWRLRGVGGGLVAGMIFVIPGALCMLALSLLFVLGSGLGWVDGLFFGIKAAVLAIVAQAVIKLSRRALRTPAFVALAAAAFAAFALLNMPFPLVIIAAALFGAAAAHGVSHGAAPAGEPQDGRWRATAVAAAGGLAAWWLPVAILALALGPGHVAVELALFFSKLAVLSFGGAYALLAWLADAAVGRGWVTTDQMIAGLGLAETTPGPTILVTQFVGFLGGWTRPGPLPPLLSAVLAALVTTWVTFAPSFLWIFAGAPWLDRLLRAPRLAGALQGITAAVVGAIAWLALWFALNTLFREAGFRDLGLLRWPTASGLEPAALALAALAFALTFGFRRSMIEVIALLAALGMAWRLAAG